MHVPRLQQLHRDDAGQHEEDGEAGQAHVGVDHAHALRGGAAQGARRGTGRRSGAAVSRRRGSWAARAQCSEGARRNQGLQPSSRPELTPYLNSSTRMKVMTCDSGRMSSSMSKQCGGCPAAAQRRKGIPRTPMRRHSHRHHADEDERIEQRAAELLRGGVALLQATGASARVCLGSAGKLVGHCTALACRWPLRSGTPKHAHPPARCSTQRRGRRRRCWTRPPGSGCAPGPR